MMRLVDRTWNHYWQARLVCVLLNAWETITRSRPSWGTFDEENGVHILPFNDAIEHDFDSDCLCGPDVEWVDPDTGDTYPNGPLVTHHSLDGRELNDRCDAGERRRDV